MRPVLALVCTAVVAACGGDARSIRLELIANLGSSCPTSTTQYDLTCVGAFELRVVNASGNVLDSGCADVRNDYSNLDDLFKSPELIPVLKDTKAKKNVRIEFRAYHAFGVEPCTELTQSRLMLWGSSGFVNLKNESQSVVTVNMECRPDCDCSDIGNTCNRDLDVGVCAPASPRLSCQRDCTDASQCYDGLLTCSEGHCRPADAGGTCAACDEADDCLSGLCAHKIDGGETHPEDFFCGIACPAQSDARPCPKNMGCKRIDGTHFEFLP